MKRSKAFKDFLLLSDKKKFSILLKVKGIEVKETKLSLSWENFKFGFSKDGSLKYIKKNGICISRVKDDGPEPEKINHFEQLKRMNGDM
jgi:hypothetical protein